MKKIIAFSSTHGTGKSSLAYMLAAKMKLAGHNVVVLDELARKCPFKINKDAGDKTEPWIICKQITEELELIDKVDYLIVDRSVFDSYVYNMVLNMRHTMCSKLITYIEEHVKAYYKMIYVPDKDSFNFQLADGVRDLDIDFRDKVFTAMVTMYESIEGVPYKIIHKPEEVYADLGV